MSAGDGGLLRMSASQEGGELLGALSKLKNSSAVADWVSNMC